MVKNGEVAELLYNIGELLELKGENPFKIRAYSKAARAVENLNADIGEISAKKELQAIPGIGTAIAKKIEEYLRTGKLEYYEKLSNEIPRGLKELLKVPGIGPKTIQIVYRKAGITDMDSLEKAAESHKLRGLLGFGETKEENIIKAIKRYRERSDRIPLGKAYLMVDEISQSTPTGAMGKTPLKIWQRLQKTEDTVTSASPTIRSRWASRRGSRKSGSSNKLMKFTN